LDARFCTLHYRDNGDLLSLRKPATERLIRQTIQGRLDSLNPVSIPIFIQFKAPGFQIPRCLHESTRSSKICEKERTNDDGSQKNTDASFWSRGVDTSHETAAPHIVFGNSNQNIFTHTVKNDHDKSDSSRPVMFLRDSNNTSGITFTSTSGDGVNNFVTRNIKAKSLEQLTIKHYRGSHGNVLDPNNTTAGFADTVVGSLGVSDMDAVGEPPRINSDEAEEDSQALGAGVPFVVKINGNDPSIIISVSLRVVTARTDKSILLHAIFIVSGVPWMHPFPFTDVVLLTKDLHGPLCILITPCRSYLAILTLYRPIDRGRPTPIFLSRTIVAMAKQVSLVADHGGSNTGDNTIGGSLAPGGNGSHNNIVDSKDKGLIAVSTATASNCKCTFGGLPTDDCTLLKMLFHGYRSVPNKYTLFLLSFLDICVHTFVDGIPIAITSSDADDAAFHAICWLVEINTGSLVLFHNVHPFPQSPMFLVDMCAVYTTHAAGPHHYKLLQMLHFVHPHSTLFCSFDAHSWGVYQCLQCFLCTWYYCFCLRQYPSCEDTKDTDHSANSAKNLGIEHSGMTPASLLEAALDRSNTNFGSCTATDRNPQDNISTGVNVSAGQRVFHTSFDVENRRLSHFRLHSQQLRRSIVKAYPFTGADEAFAIQEGNMVTLDAFMQLYISGVLTRYQPIDRGRQMVKEFPDSKSGVLASVLLIMQQRMPKSLASCVVDTTDDDMDCCTGNFDDSNCLCCYTCMVECSPFSDIDDPNGASCKDLFRNGNLNCTTNPYQECQSCMNSGSCFWQ
jgi:hypothetical protein